MKELLKKVGEMEPDGLITYHTPPVQVSGGTLSGAEGDFFPRGTLVGADGGGRVSLFAGGGKKPYGILTDDVTLDATGECPAPFYTAGCFDPARLTLAEGYDLTDADMDELRMRGIVFRASAS